MKNKDTEMVTDIIHQITKTLKEERYRQNISISKLSMLSGVNVNVIYQYEKKQKHEIELSTLLRIAYALKLDMSILFPYTIKEDPVAKQFDSIIQGLSKESINALLNIAKTEIRGESIMKKNIQRRNLKDDDLWDSVYTNDEMLTDLIKSVSKILREERCHQDMSVSKLSKLSGVSDSIIYRYEQGEMNLTLKVLVKIMSVLNLDMSKVISINPNPKVETIGEKFKMMIQNQSQENIDFILDMVSNIIDFYKSK